MGQLLFKKIFWDAIRDGNKRTTIRRWNAPRLRAGQRAFAPGLGWLRIEAVDVIELDHLTDADARTDGFETLVAMKRALRSLYPSHRRDGRKWFRVTFRPDESGNGDGNGNRNAKGNGDGVIADSQ